MEHGAQCFMDYEHPRDSCIIIHKAQYTMLHLLLTVVSLHDNRACDSSLLRACQLGSRFMKLKPRENLVFRFLEPILETLSPRKCQCIRYSDNYRVFIEYLPRTIIVFPN